MWHYLDQFIYDAVLALSCGIAIFMGGKDERIGAGIAIAASGITALVVPAVIILHIQHIRYVYLVVGIATLAAFDRLMIYSRKWWPILATGVQLATVVLNLTAIAEPALTSHIIRVRGNFAYITLLALTIGSVRSWQIHRKRGSAVGSRTRPRC